MSNPENRSFDFVDDQFTVSSMLSDTIDQLFKENDSLSLSTIYENRHISLVHLVGQADSIDSKDYHVAYKSIGAREIDNKNGLIITGVDIKREDQDGLNDDYYPRKNAIRHYYLEKIGDNSETDSYQNNEEFLTPLGQLQTMIGKLLVDDFAVRREDRYFGSKVGKSPLLAGKVFDQFANDEYEDNLQTFFEDIIETKNMKAEKVEGYGSFHQIKNLTRNIVQPNK